MFSTEPSAETSLPKWNVIIKVKNCAKASDKVFLLCFCFYFWSSTLSSIVYRYYQFYRWNQIICSRIISDVSNVQDVIPKNCWTSAKERISWVLSDYVTYFNSLAFYHLASTIVVLLLSLRHSFIQQSQDFDSVQFQILFADFQKFAKTETSSFNWN